LGIKEKLELFPTFAFTIAYVVQKSGASNCIEGIGTFHFGENHTEDVQSIRGHRRLPSTYCRFQKIE